MPSASISYVEQRMTFSSPIPPSHVVEHYDRIIPNGGDRLMTMAEKQQAHRHRLEVSVIEGDTRRADRALLFEWIVVLIFALGGIFLIYVDKTGVGVGVGLTPLCIAVLTHIWGRRAKEKEIKELRAQTHGQPDGSTTARES